METTTPKQIDASLDDATIKQLSFKDGSCRNIAVRIVESFLPDKIQWQDDVPTGEVHDDDKNCIGMTWRRLAKLGIVKRMEGADDHRRSKLKARKGGLTWKYRLANPALAVTFLKRNGWTRTRRGQPELALEMAENHLAEAKEILAINPEWKPAQERVETAEATVKKLEAQP